MKTEIEQLKKAIKENAKLAEKTSNSCDALKFTQACANAANAICALVTADHQMNQ